MAILDPFLTPPPQKKKKKKRKKLHFGNDYFHLKAILVAILCCYINDSNRLIIRLSRFGYCSTFPKQNELVKNIFTLHRGYGLG